MGCSGCDAGVAAEVSGLRGGVCGAGDGDRDFVAGGGGFAGGDVGGVCRSVGSCGREKIALLENYGVASSEVILLMEVTFPLIPAFSLGEKEQHLALLCSS